MSRKNRILAEARFFGTLRLAFVALLINWALVSTPRVMTVTMKRTRKDSKRA